MISTSSEELNQSSRGDADGTLLTYSEESSEELNQSSRGDADGTLLTHSEESSEELNQSSRGDSDGTLLKLYLALDMTHFNEKTWKEILGLIRVGRMAAPHWGIRGYSRNYFEVMQKIKEYVALSYANQIAANREYISQTSSTDKDINKINMKYLNEYNTKNIAVYTHQIGEAVASEVGFDAGAPEPERTHEENTNDMYLEALLCLDLDSSKAKEYKKFFPRPRGKGRCLVLPPSIRGCSENYVDVMKTIQNFMTLTCDEQKRVKDDWKNLCNQEKDIVEYNIYFLCDEANKDKAVRHHPRGCEIATKVGYEYDIDSDSVYGELTTMRVVWLGMKGRTRVCTLGVVQTRMM